ncbi:hypothetical protein TNIN_160801 [Trichonephila inaurata madagascariensis]|uniref:Uncharacterized protein n=1 Tax=Trichonephila inaurata madagascariensis TaxID=2747483 RepID=A0A8X6X478_9ARAC|nr:hypothetical protein TNIN_160801 [Trichonephila inaurata madagascariensis]
MLSAAVGGSSSKSFLQMFIPILVLFMFFRCCEKMVEYPDQLGNATGILKMSLEASDSGSNQIIEKVSVGVGKGKPGSAMFENGASSRIDIYL